MCEYIVQDTGWVKVSKTWGNIHSIWSCSIINSVKLYSWCALWQSSLLTWIFCGRKARKSRSVVSKFLVGVPEVFFTDTYTQHFFLLTIFHRICSASAISLLYLEELFFPALLHLVSFGPKPLKFLLGYSAGEADPQLGNGVPWVTRFSQYTRLCISNALCIQCNTCTYILIICQLNVCLKYLK